MSQEKNKTSNAKLKKKTVWFKIRQHEIIFEHFESAVITLGDLANAEYV